MAVPSAVTELFSSVLAACCPPRESNEQIPDETILNQGALSALLKQSHGAIHLFLGAKQIDHDSVARPGCVRLLAELGGQQGGPADAVGRALGITLGHGIFGFSLEPREFPLSIRCPARMRWNCDNEQEEREGESEGAPIEFGMPEPLHFLQRVNGGFGAESFATRGIT